MLILLVGFLGYKKPLDKIEGITLKGKNSNIYVENNYGSITYDNKTLDTINKYKNTEIYQADSNKVHVTNKSILGDKIIEKSTLEIYTNKKTGLKKFEIYNLNKPANLYNNLSFNNIILKIISTTNLKLEEKFQIENKVLDFSITRTTPIKHFIVNTVFFKTAYLKTELIEKRLYDLSFSKWILDKNYSKHVYPLLLIGVPNSVIIQIEQSTFKYKFKTKYPDVEIKFITLEQIDLEVPEIFLNHIVN